MNELQKIAVACEAFFQRESGVACALATVVRVEGSSYRRPGARMLITERGEIAAGCVSGGCLEADVAEWARRVIATGQPRVLTYDTLNDDPADDGDLVLGMGTGCRGVIDVLVEPIFSNDDAALSLPLRVTARRESGVLVTVYRSRSNRPRVADRMLIDQVGDVMSGPSDIVKHEAILQAAREALRSKRSQSVSVDTAATTVELFCEYIQPPPKLVICGAGADALPLARIAGEVGWHVVVADHRAAYTDPSRFPSSTEVILTRPSMLPEHVTFDKDTALVFMTHNYLLDRELLTLAARSGAFYVGLLGSRRRLQTLLADLADSGIFVQALLGDRLHAPIGMDIGADSPESIALSAVAEIHAALKGRPGGYLRDRSQEEIRAASEKHQQATEGARLHCPISD